MATISEAFATGVKTLSGTTADAITLTNRDSHKVLITNVSGATALHAIIRDLTSAVGSAGTLTMDTEPVGDAAAQGTLTIAEAGSGGVQAVGTMTIAEPVSDGDTYTLDAKVYTLETSLTNVDGNVAIGGSEAQTKLNLIAAIDLSGTAGVDYATAMTAHTTITAAAFSGDTAAFTAVLPGTAGNALVSTETFTHGSNVFDATTLGTTTAGVEEDTFTIDSKVYRLQTTLTNVNGNIALGGSEAQTKLNIVAAVNYLQTTGATTGKPGTDFAAAMTAHPTVSISDFTGDDAILTADSTGVAGDALVSTETFAGATNVFDATTLGAVTAGTDADTLTLDTRVYTFTSALTPTDAKDTVLIGANLAAAKVNLVAAINLTGTAGTEYSEAHSTAHATVSVAAFAGDDMVATAKITGTSGNSIATTETFLAGSNVFDAATLGTTTAGVERVATTATAAADRHVIPAGLTLEVPSKQYGVREDGLVMSLVGNGNTYVVQLVD